MAAKPPLVRHRSTFEQTFGTPATVWNVAHNLGYSPGIEVRDPDGYIVLCEVQHTSLYQTQIRFVAAQTGSVRCG